MKTSNHDYYLKLEPILRVLMADTIKLLIDGRERTVPELAQRMKISTQEMYRVMQAVLHLKLVRPTRYITKARTTAMLAAMKKRIDLMGTGKARPGRPSKPMTYRLVTVV